MGVDVQPALKVLCGTPLLILAFKQVRKTCHFLFPFNFSFFCFFVDFFFWLFVVGWFFFPPHGK